MNWLMRLSRARKTLLAIGMFIVIYVVVQFFLPSSSNWIDIGKGGPKKWQDFQYRLIELTGAESIPPTHPDLTSLTLNLQAGGARNAWIYLPVYMCYAPSVRNGVPSVMCSTTNNSDVFIGGKDNIREVLLSLRSSGKRGAVQGRAMGLYADTPVIWVNDPALKPTIE